MFAYLFEARGIQQYIIETGKVKDMIGASLHRGCAVLFFWWFGAIFPHLSRHEKSQGSNK